MALLQKRLGLANGDVDGRLHASSNLSYPLRLIPIAGNRHLLKLRAALDNLHNFGVSQIPLHWIVIATTISAMELYGIVCRFNSYRGSKVFGHPCLHDSIWITNFFQITGLVAK